MKLVFSVWVAMSLLWLGACSPPEARRLYVDFSTTYVPFQDFDSIRVELGDEAITNVVERSVDYGHAVRVAEFSATGDVRVVVTLLLRESVVRTEERFVVSHGDDQVVRIQIMAPSETDASVDAGVDASVDALADRGMGQRDGGPDVRQDVGCAGAPFCEANTFMRCVAGAIVSRECLYTCVPGESGGCFDLVPSNLGADAYVEGPLRVFTGQTWNTTLCELPARVVGDHCVLSVASVVFEGEHRVIGDRPLIVLSSANLSIRGNFTAIGDQRTPGPGGRRGLDTRSSLPHDGSLGEHGEQGDGGGGGGGGGAIGGSGGEMENGGAGGSALDGECLVPLLGGGGGGGGESPDGIEAGGYGGGGGGALQFSARGTLELAGVINISGGGGHGGQVWEPGGVEQPNRGGGGGGGGGSLLLESGGEFILTGQVFASGGGGAGAGISNGQPGGQETGSGARGGDPAEFTGFAGAGGDGGTSGAGQSGGHPEETRGNGGGGGGGAGLVVLSLVASVPVPVGIGGVVVQCPANLAINE